MPISRINTLAGSQLPVNYFFWHHAMLNVLQYIEYGANWQVNESIYKKNFRLNILSGRSID
jgi:hypothetical protein